MNVSLCILTRNAAATVRPYLSALNAQNFTVCDCLVVDSQSEDNTLQWFSGSDWRVHQVSPLMFDHGGTRKLSVELCPAADFIIFMTQDAILTEANTLLNLVKVFDDPSIAAAYGRQLPAKEATPISAHARLFNYPAEGCIKGKKDIPDLGLKTTFISNSFSAYRRSALKSIGNFPSRCIVSEDTYVAAKMILAGWKIAYCADAQVYHSHNYNWRQEFQRYFDIGVFHAREPWVREKFGGAEGEGRRFFISEMKFLLSRAPHLLLSACSRSAIKYLGFRAGLAEQYLPLGLKRQLSMQKSFWRTTDMESSDA